MDDETRALLNQMNDTMAALLAQQHATRLVLAMALAMAPIDLDELLLRLMGQRHRAAEAAPEAVVDSGALPAVAAAIDRVVAVAASWRAEQPPAPWQAP